MTKDVCFGKHVFIINLTLRNNFLNDFKDLALLGSRALFSFLNVYKIYDIQYQIK
jgi:hypothetical protein